MPPSACGRRSAPAGRTSKPSLFNWRNAGPISPGAPSTGPSNSSAIPENKSALNATAYPTTLGRHSGAPRSGSRRFASAFFQFKNGGRRPPMPGTHNHGPWIWIPGSLASHSRRLASAFLNAKNGGRRPPTPRNDDRVISRISYYRRPTGLFGRRSALFRRSLGFRRSLRLHSRRRLALRTRGGRASARCIDRAGRALRRGLVLRGGLGRKSESPPEPPRKRASQGMVRFGGSFPYDLPPSPPDIGKRASLRAPPRYAGATSPVGICSESAAEAVERAMSSLVIKKQWPPLRSTASWPALW
jgi:hypothetical protein